MTIREQAYQRFTFGRVTFDHREALTSSEHKVYEMHKSGHCERSICERLQLSRAMVMHHLRMSVHKGWLDE